MARQKTTTITGDHPKAPARSIAATPDEPPPDARTVPAIRHRIGRNRYACQTPKCAARLRLSNGDTVTCPRCQRSHRLHNPTLQHWHDRTDQP